MGSIRGLTDSTGQTTDSDDTDPWGEPLESEWAYGDTPNPFRYNGRIGYYTDAESGLDLLGVRYYDPKIGRFITPDPIGLEGGDLNLYRYVKDRPTVATDQDGLVPPGRKPKDPCEPGGSDRTKPTNFCKGGQGMDPYPQQ